MKAYVRRIGKRLDHGFVAEVHQVRGKKNLVIEESLAGPIGLFVKFSTLQDHGVDKVFLLENDNVDASQKNVIFLARGEKANQPIAVAGMYVISFLFLRVDLWFSIRCNFQTHLFISANMQFVWESAGKMGIIK